MCNFSDQDSHIIRWEKESSLYSHLSRRYGTKRIMYIQCINNHVLIYEKWLLKIKVNGKVNNKVGNKQRLWSVLK